MFRARTILLLALLTLLLLAPAASAGEWVAPVNFPVPSADFFGGSPGEEQIAYQNGGTATEAFIQLASLAPVATVLHVGAMPPGGGYSDQLTIASSEDAIPAAVKIAVAPDGAAVAGWAELTGSSVETSPYRFRVAYRPAGSATWEGPVTVATEAVRNSAVNIALAPAISANGTAAVGIQYNANEKGKQNGESTARLDIAERSASGSWSTQRISPTQESAESLSLAYDLDGNLTAAYLLRFNENADRSTVIVQRRPAGSGVWGPLEDITGSKIQWSAFGLHLGENEFGDAVVAYQYAGPSAEVWAATRQSPSASWSEPEQLVSTGATSAPEDAGVAPNGTAYVLYSFQGTSSGEDCAGVVRAPANGSFGYPHCISPLNEDSASGSVAFLSSDAYFAWTGNTPVKPAR